MVVLQDSHLEIEAALSNHDVGFVHAETGGSNPSGLLRSTLSKGELGA